MIVIFFIITLSKEEIIHIGLQSLYVSRCKETGFHFEMLFAEFMIGKCKYWNFIVSDHDRPLG